MKVPAKKATTKKTATKKVAAKKIVKKNNLEDEQAYKEFKSLVNMNAGTLEKWLITKESKKHGSGQR